MPLFIVSCIYKISYTSGILQSCRSYSWCIPSVIRFFEGTFWFWSIFGSQFSPKKVPCRSIRGHNLKKLVSMWCIMCVWWYIYISYVSRIIHVVFSCKGLQSIVLADHVPSKCLNGLWLGGGNHPKLTSKWWKKSLNLHKHTLGTTQSCWNQKTPEDYPWLLIWNHFLRTTLLWYRYFGYLFPLPFASRLYIISYTYLAIKTDRMGFFKNIG